MYKHIMIPTDGSKLSDKAIDAGVEFAKEVKARVTGFTAVPEYQMPSEVELMSRHGISFEQYERDARPTARAPRASSTTRNSCRATTLTKPSCAPRTSTVAT